MGSGTPLLRLGYQATSLPVKRPRQARLAHPRTNGTWTIGLSFSRTQTHTFAPGAKQPCASSESTSRLARPPWARRPGGEHHNEKPFILLESANRSDDHAQANGSLQRYDQPQEVDPNQVCPMMVPPAGHAHVTIWSQCTACTPQRRLDRPTIIRRPDP